jgi:endonuclease VIII
MPEGHTVHRLARDRARRVYKQQNCYDCGTAVEVAEIGGRTSYSCPRCQAR